jgi:hypothetical protein
LTLNRNTPTSGRAPRVGPLTESPR